MAIWMQELDGIDIPDIPLTDGTCDGSPENYAKAADNAWWSCGGYTRDTDVTVCPTKYTWGVSFDDGPGPYTGCVFLPAFHTCTINLTYYAENCSNFLMIRI